VRPSVSWLFFRLLPVLQDSANSLECVRAFASSREATTFVLSQPNGTNLLLHGCILRKVEEVWKPVFLHCQPPVVASVSANCRVIPFWRLWLYDGMLNLNLPSAVLALFAEMAAVTLRFFYRGAKGEPCPAAYSDKSKIREWYEDFLDVSYDESSAEFTSSQSDLVAQFRLFEDLVVKEVTDMLRKTLELKPLSVTVVGHQRSLKTEENVKELESLASFVWAIPRAENQRHVLTLLSRNTVKTVCHLYPELSPPFIDLCQKSLATFALPTTRITLRLEAALVPEQDSEDGAEDLTRAVVLGRRLANTPYVVLSSETFQTKSVTAGHTVTTYFIGYFFHSNMLSFLDMEKGNRGKFTLVQYERSLAEAKTALLSWVMFVLQSELPPDVKSLCLVSLVAKHSPQVNRRHQDAKIWATLLALEVVLEDKFGVINHILQPGEVQATEFYRVVKRRMTDFTNSFRPGTKEIEQLDTVLRKRKGLKYGIYLSKPNMDHAYKALDATPGLCANVNLTESVKLNVSSTSMLQTVLDKFETGALVVCINAPRLGDDIVKWLAEHTRMVPWHWFWFVNPNMVISHLLAETLDRIEISPYVDLDESDTAQHFKSKQFAPPDVTTSSSMLRVSRNVKAISVPAVFPLAATDFMSPATVDEIRASALNDFAGQSQQLKSQYCADWLSEYKRLFRDDSELDSSSPTSIAHLVLGHPSVFAQALAAVRRSFVRRSKRNRSITVSSREVAHALKTIKGRVSNELERGCAVLLVVAGFGNCKYPDEHNALCGTLANLRGRLAVLFWVGDEQPSSSAECKAAIAKHFGERFVEAEHMYTATAEAYFFFRAKCQALLRQLLSPVKSSSEFSDFVLIVGEPGLGKTEALNGYKKSFARRSPDHMCVDFDGSSTDLVKSSVTDLLCTRLQPFLDRKKVCLLVVDEYHFMNMDQKEQLMRFINQATGSLAVVMISNRYEQADLELFARTFAKFNKDTNVLAVRNSLPMILPSCGEALHSFLKPWCRVTRNLFGEALLSFRFIKQVTQCYLEHQKSLRSSACYQGFAKLLQNKETMITATFALSFVEEFFARLHEPRDFVRHAPSLTHQTPAKNIVVLLLAAAWVDHDQNDESDAATYPEYSTRLLRNFYSYHPVVRLLGWVQYKFARALRFCPEQHLAAATEFVQGLFSVEKLRLLSLHVIQDSPGRFPSIHLQRHGGGVDALTSCQIVSQTVDPTDLVAVRRVIARGFAVDETTIQRVLAVNHVTDYQAFCALLDRYSAAIEFVCDENLCSLIELETGSNLFLTWKTLTLARLQPVTQEKFDPRKTAQWKLYRTRRASPEHARLEEQRLVIVDSAMEKTEFDLEEILLWASKHAHAKTQVESNLLSSVNSAFQDDLKSLIWRLGGSISPSDFGASHTSKPATKVISLAMNTFAHFVRTLELPAPLTLLLAASQHPPSSEWTPLVKALSHLWAGYCTADTAEALLHTTLLNFDGSRMHFWDYVLTLPTEQRDRIVMTLLQVRPRPSPDWIERVLTSSIKMPAELATDRVLLRSMEPIMKKFASSAQDQIRIAREGPFYAAYAAYRDLLFQTTRTSFPLGKTVKLTTDVPQHVVFVIDRSGSMGITHSARPSRHDILRRHPTPLGAVYECCTRVISANCSVEGNKFSFVFFGCAGDRPAHLQRLEPRSSADAELILGHLLNIDVNGSTNYDAGFQQAAAAIADVPGMDTTVIFLTDGCPNSPLQDVNMNLVAQRQRPGAGGRPTPGPKPAVHLIMFGDDGVANLELERMRTRLSMFGAHCEQHNAAMNLDDLIRVMSKCVKKKV
jgi:hypothetical protein